MDQKAKIRFGDNLKKGIERDHEETAPAVMVSGLGWEISPDAWQCLIGNQTDPSRLQLTHDCDPTGYLRAPKTIKYMSKQDRLAVTASGKALEGAGYDLEKLNDSCGLFMTVGYIPFKREEAERISGYSQDQDQFSMLKFSTDAYDSINPLLAFACLPNMPAYHLSANFNLQGQYVLTYPGTVQFYQVLSEAVQRLQNGDLKRAIVGGVSDQCNFLVENHFQKYHAVDERRSSDAAAFMILERLAPAPGASRRDRIKLVSLHTRYTRGAESSEHTLPKFRLGPAELPMLLGAFAHDQKGLFRHCCRSETHIVESVWEVL
jgi:hypothetical protein